MNLPPIMETLGALAVAVVIIIGGREVIQNELTVGAFFSFMTALFMLYTPIKRLSSLYNTMQDALAANERINTIFNHKATILGGKDLLPEKIESIKFKDVVLKYDDKIALDGINLEAFKGETIALVGDSGGGKSSLINLIIRFYDTFSGQISFNNQEIKNFDIKSLRKHISVVTQRVYIFNDTIAANIAYGFSVDEKSH